MFVLRSTRKLLQRMGHAGAQSEPPKSTTKLGDWTANLLMVGRQQLVLAVSNVTLLPVLLPAAPLKTLPARLPEAVGQMLEALRIDPQKIASEVGAMSDHIVAPTRDRRVLGSMNDFDRMLDAYLDGRPLRDVALHLAEAPCGPIAMESPRRASLALFDQVVRDPPRSTLRLVKG